MKKPDLSKAAMSKFFLYHTEKLILVISLALLGLFFWMGFKVKPFSDQTPSEVSKLADKAGNYINSSGAWDEIKEFRKGDKDIAEKVRNTVAVDASKFTYDPITGIVAATLAPRQDPKLLPIQFVEARSFRAPLILALSEPLIQDPFFEFPAAGVAADIGGMGGGRGAGAPGGDFGEGEGGDEEPDGDFGGDFGGGGGARGAGGGGRGGPTGFGGGSAEAEDETEIPELKGMGTQLGLVNLHTAKGIRPTSMGIPASQSKSFVYDIVAVTGLVDFKTQWKEFETCFSQGIGYYPDRDKPIYQYLEVQRREVGADGQPANGKAGAWADWSEMVSFNVPSAYPEMHRMPNALYSTAPDKTAPENYDPILTGPVPPVVQFDYLPLVSHSKLTKYREFPKFEVEEEQESIGAEDIFTGGGGNSPIGGGSARGGRGSGMGAPGGGRGGSGMGAPGGGRGAQGGGRGGAPAMGGRGAGRGGGMAGRGGGMAGRGGGMAGRGGGMSGRGGDSEELEATRAGSDFADYTNALDSKDQPSENYRLVRFFDVLAYPGKTYEYRMRAWLADPNNEDPDQVFASMTGSGGMPMGGMGGRGMGGRGMGGGRGEGGLGGGEGLGGGGDEESDGDGMGMAGGGSRSRRTRSGGGATGGAPGEEEEDEAEWVAITSTMLHPSVRIRLSKQQEIEDEKLGITNYVSAEFRGKDENGKDIVEDIPVPRVPVGKDLDGVKIYEEYLKHARPTEWSGTVKIAIRPDNSQVAAGKIVAPKKSTYRTPEMVKQYPVGEPTAEVAASVWWKKDLGTALPTVQTVRRGDALDFYTPTYFLHPVTWQVLVAKNLETDEGEAQFVVPVETGKVLVDIMGGEEIPLPKAEKMRHNFASEMLVMNEYGEFSIQNDQVDRAKFRNMLFLEDESQTVGRPRRRKKRSSMDAPEGEGGFGRGGGGRGAGGGGFGEGDGF